MKNIVIVDARETGGVISDEVLSDVSKFISENKPKNPVWMNLLTEREISEIEFAQLYSREYNHGTDGHNRLNLIAKLVDIINQDFIESVGE